MVEAKNRQIIVFTHDLVFYSELRAAAKVQQVECVTHHIEAFTCSIAKVSGPEPWDALSGGERLQKLDGLLKQAKDADESSDSERYRYAVAIFYARLRSTWERGVEELLFNKVAAFIHIVADRMAFYTSGKLFAQFAFKSGVKSFTQKHCNISEGQRRYLSGGKP